MDGFAFSLDLERTVDTNYNDLWYNVPVVTGIGDEFLYLSYFLGIYCLYLL